MEYAQFKITSSYKSAEDEVRFMRELLTREAPEVCCKYVMYKIFHFLLLIHQISLTCFTCDFIQNEAGSFALYGATIYDLETRRTEIESLPNREDVILPTDDLVKKMKEEQLLYAEKLAVQDPPENAKRITREEKENQEFLRRLEVIMMQNKTSDPKSGQMSTLRTAKLIRNQQYRKFWSVIPELPPKEDRNHKLEIYQELKEDFQRQIKPVQKEIDQSEDTTFQKQLVEQTDKAFMEVNPGFHKKLSELVTSNNYQFRKEYAQFLKEKKAAEHKEQPEPPRMISEQYFSQEFESNRKSRPDISSFERSDFSRIPHSHRSGEASSHRQNVSNVSAKIENKSVLSSTMNPSRQTKNPGSLFKIDMSGHSTVADNSAQGRDVSNYPSSSRSFLNAKTSVEQSANPYLDIERKELLQARLQAADTIRGFDNKTFDHKTAKVGEGLHTKMGDVLRKGEMESPVKMSRTVDKQPTVLPKLRPHSRNKSMGTVSDGIMTVPEHSNNGSMLQSFKQNADAVRDSTNIWSERYKTEFLRKKHMNISISDRQTVKLWKKESGIPKTMMVKDMVESGPCPPQIISKFQQMVENNIDPGLWSWSPGAREMKTLQSQMRVFNIKPLEGSPQKSSNNRDANKSSSKKLLAVKKDLRLLLRKQGNRLHPNKPEVKDLDSLLHETT